MWSRAERRVFVSPFRQRNGIRDVHRIHSAEGKFTTQEFKVKVVVCVRFNPIAIQKKSALYTNAVE